MDPNPPNATHGYDALLATPTAFGDAANVPGKLLDITYLVSGDQGLQWTDFSAQFRSAMAQDGAVVALPLIPSPFFLYYHLDIFKRDNLSVPQTWEQLADLAERYHGRDGMMGACMLAAGCRTESIVLRMIFGSYVQTHGPAHGVFWDPDTLDPLVNTPAMEAALKVFRRLRALNPNATVPLSCQRRDYVRGRCLFSINAGTEFKLGSLWLNSTMRGRMGMALPPGSTRVLDRQTRQLVPCDKDRCPRAQDTALDEDGVQRPVNRPIASSSIAVLFNGLSPPQYQFYAYNIFSYLITTGVLGTTGLLLKDNEILPMRGTDVALSNLPMWVQEGYDREDTIRFLSVYSRIFSSDNLNGDLKLRLTTNITNALADAAILYNNKSAGADVLAVMTKLEAVLNAVVAAEGGKAGFGPKYRSSINWVPQTEGAASGGGSNRFLIIALTVGLGGCAALLLTLAVARAVALRRRSSPRSRAPSAPGPGPATALLVTDIQDSTLLWEALPAQTMDAALKLHHRIIRELLLVHHGYESATEGDSFILAFHSPRDAALFALEAQQALLDAPWPPALLHHAPIPGVAHPDDPAAEMALMHRPPARVVKASAPSPVPSKSLRRSRSLPRSRGGISADGTSPVSAPFPALAGSAGQGITDMPGQRNVDTQQPRSAYSGPILHAPAPVAASGPCIDGAEMHTRIMLPQPTGSSVDSSKQLKTCSMILELPMQSLPYAASGELPLSTIGGDSAAGGPISADSSSASLQAGSRRHACVRQAGGGDSGRHGPSRLCAGQLGEHRTSALGFGPASCDAVLDKASGRCEQSGKAAISLSRESPGDRQPQHGTAGWSGSPARPSTTRGVPQLLTSPTSSIRTGPVRMGARPSPLRGSQLRRVSQGQERPTGMQELSASIPIPAASDLTGSMSLESPGRSSIAGVQLWAGLSGLREAMGGSCPSSLDYDASQQHTPSDNVGTSPLAAGFGGMAKEPCGPFVSMSLNLLQSDHLPQIDEQGPGTPASGSGPLIFSGNGLRLEPLSPAFCGKMPVVAWQTYGDIVREQYMHVGEKDPEDGGGGGGGRTKSSGGPSPAAGTRGRDPPRRVVAFRGLRVRMGLHAGVPAQRDVSRNAATGRMQYSGMPLRLAKAVSDAAAGGGVLLSESAAAALAADEAAARALASALLLWAGRHRLGPGLAPGEMHLFQLVGRGLLGRLALQRPPRTLGVCPPLCGVLAAPAAGRGVFARLTVVGASTLLAWDYRLASCALDLLYEAVLEGLRHLGEDAPYIAEGALGLHGGASGPATVAAVQGCPPATMARPSRPWDRSGMSSWGSPSRDHASGLRAWNGAASGSLWSRSLPSLGSGPSAAIKRQAVPSSDGHLSCEDGEASGRIQVRGLADAMTVAGTVSMDGRASACSGPLSGPLTTGAPASGGAWSRADRVTAGGGGARLSSKRGSNRIALAATLAQSAAAWRSEGGGGGRPGVLTAVFGSAGAAALWLLHVVDLLPCLDWPAELLRHPLCEEVAFEGAAVVVAPSLHSDANMLLSRLHRRDSVRMQHLQHCQTAGSGGGMAAAPALDQVAACGDGDVMGAVEMTPDDSVSVQVGLGLRGITLQPSADAVYTTGPAQPDASSIPGGSSHPGGSQDAGLAWRGPAPGSSRLHGGGPDGPGYGGGVVFRGLRVRCGLAAGELGGELAAGLGAAGQLAYRGRAWAAAGRLAARARAGEIATNAATAAQLPEGITQLLTVHGS